LIHYYQERAAGPSGLIISHSVGGLYQSAQKDAAAVCPIIFFLSSFVSATVAGEWRLVQPEMEDEADDW